MKNRSSAVSPAPARTKPQQSPHQSQLSGVSKTRNGGPVVPEVRWIRVYADSGKVQLVLSGLSSWAAMSSAFVVNGRFARSSRVRTSAGATPAPSSFAVTN